MTLLVHCWNFVKSCELVRMEVFDGSPEWVYRWSLSVFRVTLSFAEVIEDTWYYRYFFCLRAPCGWEWIVCEWNQVSCDQWMIIVPRAPIGMGLWIV